ncbi:MULTISPECIES: permease [unclassified Fusibacter]|uniref:permease n=1 Tax=unclassified Fusibacter TaxID=2624464 RepID=UPI0010117912|nr:MULTISPECIES: permease [unclassified Fusibacter]MCK8060034.1 permease [Fusibacter sp. A2]NPE22174.1 permease [Fusibacter sp. A1]RXV60950.1 permease [Fusibacter sp. A1]
MFTIILYVLAAGLFLISLFKNKKKTKMALKKSLKMFMNLLPQLLALFIFVGMLLAIVDQSVISSLIGEKSGVMGVVIASITGSITLLPGFVAFPLASNLLNHGAGLPQIAAFVSSLMMVGIATFALESKTVGKKVALLRNGMAFVYSFVVALIIGGLL